MRNLRQRIDALERASVGVAPMEAVVVDRIIICPMKGPIGTMRRHSLHGCSFFDAAGQELSETDWRALLSENRHSSIAEARREN
ncbi:hypothetical protein [Mesorhizobium sp. ANAO-SY3R2]|uniref:hypothetical protein n=1 Tax=Mesorhizobium sp. ANAO-SY3R2 TaxID=3166644 RepID=UPI00366AFA20